MTMRKHSPAHDFWHPRVEGQIRDAMYAHPEWFGGLTGYELKHSINGIAKRIVGEIVAVSAEMLHIRNNMVCDCTVSEQKNGDAKLPFDGRDMGPTVSRPIAEQP